MWVSERLNERSSVGSIGLMNIRRRRDNGWERESLYSECGADVNTSGGV